MTNRQISPDSLIARIKTLRRRHRDLDAQVEAEQLRPWPDTHRIKNLKQQRLGLKDAIEMTRTMLVRSGSQPPSYS
jgi:hypothetical protein